MNCKDILYQTIIYDEIKTIVIVKHCNKETLGVYIDSQIAERQQFEDVKSPLIQEHSENSTNVSIDYYNCHLGIQT